MRCSEGDWSVRVTDDGKVQVVCADEDRGQEVLAEVRQAGDLCLRPSAIEDLTVGNATLMAAAPRLLATVRAVCFYLAGGNIPPDVILHICDEDLRQLSDLGLLDMAEIRSRAERVAQLASEPLPPDFPAGYDSDDEGQEV